MVETQPLGPCRGACPCPELAPAKPVAPLCFPNAVPEPSPYGAAVGCCCAVSGPLRCSPPPEWPLS
ncbi:hypothetical protein BJX68DRAFT_249365 [Aspergillus pseudodeflectus]|uniref:Uncharacterized protein n=1 Tax=Aspergillus pseudodeflectus TaxID=176178 RepID=A0ABR4JEG7_9EURO